MSLLAISDGFANMLCLLFIAWVLAMMWQGHQRRKENGER